MTVMLQFGYILVFLFFRLFVCLFEMGFGLFGELLKHLIKKKLKVKAWVKNNIIKDSGICEGRWQKFWMMATWSFGSIIPLFHEHRTSSLNITIRLHLKQPLSNYASESHCHLWYACNPQLKAFTLLERTTIRHWSFWPINIKKNCETLTSRTDRLNPVETVTVPNWIVRPIVSRRIDKMPLDRTSQPIHSKMQINQQQN